MFQQAEAGGVTISSVSADVDIQDPDATTALRSTAWHLALLQRHYHPTVRELAAKLAKQEPLPARFVNATPLKLMSTFDQDNGNFQPAPQPPKPHRFAAALKADPTAVKMLGATPSSSLPEVRGALEESRAAADHACTASFGSLAEAALAAR